MECCRCVTASELVEYGDFDPDYLTDRLAEECCGAKDPDVVSAVERIVAAQRALGDIDEWMDREDVEGEYAESAFYAARMSACQGPLAELYGLAREGR